MCSRSGRWLTSFSGGVAGGASGFVDLVEERDEIIARTVRLKETHKRQIDTVSQERDTLIDERDNVRIRSYAQLRRLATEHARRRQL